MRQFLLAERAFTLLELLVSISIVGALTALGLASLGEGKGAVRDLACKQNLGQLQLAWSLYADENNEGLVPNRAYNSISGSLPGSWVVGSVKTEVNPSRIRAGLLFAYVKTVAIYRCPSDTTTTSVLQPRFRSYSLSSSMNGNPNFNPITRYSQTSRSGPANLFTFIDEHEESIDDGMFGIWAYPFDAWFNLPSARHGRWTNMGFADGHAGRMRWQAPKQFVTYVQSATNAEDLVDLRTLQDALPQQ